MHSWGAFTRISPSTELAGRRSIGDAALGVGQLVVGVVERGHGEDRALGEAVARHDADAADLLLQVVVQLRRLRRAAAGERPHLREQLLGRPVAGLGQVGLVEERARAGQRHLVVVHERDRSSRGRTPRRPGWRCPAMQRREQPDDPADVGEREDEGRGRSSAVSCERGRSWRRPRPRSCRRCAARPWDRPSCPTCRRSSAPRRTPASGYGASDAGSPSGSCLSAMRTSAPPATSRAMAS